MRNSEEGRVNHIIRRRVRYYMEVHSRWSEWSDFSNSSSATHATTRTMHLCSELHRVAGIKLNSYFHSSTCKALALAL